MSALAATCVGAPAYQRRPLAARRATTTRCAAPRVGPNDVQKGVHLSRRAGVLLPAALVTLAAPQRANSEPLKTSFYEYTVQRNGEPFALDAFKGKVTVVMNVASE